MKPSEEFKLGLTSALNEKAGNKQLALFDGMLDKLMELLMGLFDQCIGQLTPGQVAQRISAASESDRIRFRTRVRKNVYDSSKQYRELGGQHVADSVFEQTSLMGAERCEQLVREMTEGDNWWPNSEFDMG